MKLNRTQFDGKASKVLTPVAFDEVINPASKKNSDRYALSAVVMHCGDTPQSGHYTIFRKQNEQWFWLDDDWRQQREWEAVKDLAKYVGDSNDRDDPSRFAGLSAMMLFKKA
jgi:ubiquitin C-terminal hydrolase